MKFTKKDFYFSIITGCITGFSAWRIFEYLNVPEIGARVVYCIKAPCPPIGGISWMLLIFVVPIFWVVGVNLGYFLGRWFGFFNQFGKFAAIGFTNAAVYFSVLNSLIYFSGFNRGFWYSVFVAGAFVIGTGHSYFWNKFWVFESGQKQSTAEELGKFFGVYVVAGVVNTGIASAVVNFTTPLFSLTADQWANVGGVAGSAVALLISFVGVKLAVFKK